MAVKKRKVLTVCPYCGTGCGLYLTVEDGRITGIEGDARHPVNEGELCVKGYQGYQFLGHRDRLTSPLIREGHTFTQVSWEVALDFAADKLSRIKRDYGPDAFALLASARATNEEAYLAQKFTRAVMGTNNVDHCARL